MGNAEVTAGTLPLSPPGDGLAAWSIWGGLAVASESNADVTSRNRPVSPPAKGPEASFGPDSFLPDHIESDLFNTTAVPRGMEMLKGKTIWFNSTNQFQSFWQSQQKPGRFNHVADWDLLH